MATILITNETMRAVREAAIYDFNQTGRQQADGTWLIEINDDLAERLARIALPGEATDDTIQRAIRQLRGERTN